MPTAGVQLDGGFWTGSMAQAPACTHAGTTWVSANVAFCYLLLRSWRRDSASPLHLDT